MTPQHNSSKKSGRSPFAWFNALNTQAQVFLGLVAFASLVAGCALAASSVVTETELAAHASAEAAIDKEQNEDLDLQFETQVKLVGDVEWLKLEVRGMRQDFRDYDRGRPLVALPPSPVQTSAPTPRPSPPSQQAPP